MKKTKESFETLTELWLGILPYAAVCQLVPVWFVKDRAGYSAGLWIGLALAFAGAYHMWHTLDTALELGEGGAKKSILKNSALRYAAVVLVLLFLMITEAGNPLSAFLGLMGVKAGALLQPSVHKLLQHYHDGKRR